MHESRRCRRSSRIHRTHPPHLPSRLEGEGRWANQAVCPGSTGGVVMNSCRTIIRSCETSGGFLSSTYSCIRIRTVWCFYSLCEVYCEVCMYCYRYLRYLVITTQYNALVSIGPSTWSITSSTRDRPYPSRLSSPAGRVLSFPPEMFLNLLQNVRCTVVQPPDFV